MKRDSDREEGEVESEEDSVAANCLMLLSRVGEGSSASSGGAAGQQPQTVSPGRVFECKTCNRQFSSFQALGGHRASHKKPRLDLVVAPSSPPKPKMHACAICGEKFPIGQALGGHMRRHRPASAASGDLKPPPKRTVPVLKKSSSGKRVFCVDLNLTPMENDLKLEFGRLAPVI